MIESFLQNCSYSDDDSLIMSIFLEIMWKMAKIWFFLKLTLWLPENFLDLFSAFESQHNIQIEYM